MAEEVRRMSIPVEADAKLETDLDACAWILVVCQTLYDTQQLMGTYAECRKLLHKR